MLSLQHLSYVPFLLNIPSAANSWTFLLWIVSLQGNKLVARLLFSHPLECFYVPVIQLRYHSTWCRPHIQTIPNISLHLFLKHVIHNFSKISFIIFLAYILFLPLLPLPTCRSLSKGITPGRITEHEAFCQRSQFCGWCGALWDVKEARDTESG